MATKPQFPAGRLVHKQTRPGTPPNEPGGDRLVNVTDGKVRRVKRSAAEVLVAQGWKYCPKKARRA